jgi:hypothetical protein
MKLGKALKYKNRLIRKINKIKGDISSNNSRDKEEQVEVNVKDLMEEYKRLVKEFVDLKLKIFEASRPIREHIFKMSELKSEISWLSGISTKRGVVKYSSYHSEADKAEFEAAFSRMEIDEMIKNNEEEIDKMQEEIDTFNYTTEIN